MLKEKNLAVQLCEFIYEKIIIFIINYYFINGAYL